MDPQTPEVPVAPVVEPPKKDSHWITILAMAAFVLASLSTIAFLYYQNQQLKSMLASYQTQAAPTPSATPDPSADWKTYTNTSIGISFNYPKDWVVSFETKDEPFKEYKIIVSNGEYKLLLSSTTAGYGGIICNFTDSTKDEFAGPGLDQLYNYYNLEKFLDKNARRNKDPIASLDQYGYQRNELDYTFRVCNELESLGSDSKKGYTGTFNSDKGTLEVVYYTPRFGIDVGNMKILDQIVSTFKFTD